MLLSAAAQTMQDIAGAGNMVLGISQCERGIHLGFSRATYLLEAYPFVVLVSTQ